MQIVCEVCLNNQTGPSLSMLTQCSTLSGILCTRTSCLFRQVQLQALKICPSSQRLRPRSSAKIKPGILLADIKTAFQSF